MARENVDEEEVSHHEQVGPSGQLWAYRTYRKQSEPERGWFWALDGTSPSAGEQEERGPYPSADQARAAAQQWIESEALGL